MLAEKGKIKFILNRRKKNNENSIHQIYIFLNLPYREKLILKVVDYITVPIGGGRVVYITIFSVLVDILYSLDKVESVVSGNVVGVFELVCPNHVIC